MSNLFNTEQLSKSTKYSLSGILWFLALIPVAMLMHWFAKYYEMIGFTIMGWFIATLGAIQLGMAIAYGGKRLLNFPVKGIFVPN